MKILLIQPSQIIGEGRVYKAKKLMFPSLSLPLLASLTSPEFHVEIIDEYFDEIPFDNTADLIGISLMTPQAPRAYQIGDEFKKRGKKVVMGGIHASAVPEEALQHSDAVVVGEAEEIWPQVLEDFKHGKMEGIYKSSNFPTLKRLPTPRYDLLKKERYRLLNFNFPIQAGRGCPFKCEFCSVTKFFGGEYRWRQVDEVVREIQQANVKKIFFVDDNIIGQKTYARELFKALIPLKLRWGGQASLNVAKDEELLRLAAESGCGLLYIGIESISNTNLPIYGKNFFKVEEISDYFSKIRNEGILIRASIIFGLEDDDPDIFQRTVSFLIKEKVAYADFNILTPMPGTELRRKLEKENRITDFDWSRYDGLHVVFQPLKMGKEKLEKGLWDAYKEFYSASNIFKRVLGSEKHNSILRTILSNFIYRKIAYKRRHPLCGE
jgi:radical SAM superfamily enzyme YgiQ (UPF0313 family)